MPDSDRPILISTIGLPRSAASLATATNLSAVAALDEPGNHARVWIVQQVAHVVGELQVGFVASGDDVAVADAGVGGAGLQRTEGGRSALTHQPDCASRRCASRDRLDGHGPDVVLDVGYPETVRTAHPQARFSREGRRLACRPRPSGFRARRSRPRSRLPNRLLCDG